MDAKVKKIPLKSNYTLDTALWYLHNYGCEVKTWTTQNQPLAPNSNYYSTSYHVEIYHPKLGIRISCCDDKSGFYYGHRGVAIKAIQLFNEELVKMGLVKENRK